MRTTLPTLSYNPTGFEWSEDIHRSAYTRGRALSRTDLEHFNPWGTFTTEINDAITARMLAMNIPFGAEYDVGSLPTKQRVVDNEEAVRHEAIVQLHNLVEDVLSILGIQGRLALSVSGNSQIIGEPDFSWLRANTKHPKVVAEYKTKWAAPLQDLPTYFQRRAGNLPRRERQSVDALFQLYGYMTFSDNKYGILNNMEHAWFFQRVKTPNGRGKTLEYYGPINFDSDHSPSMLKAFVGIILLAETASSTWFHSSPTSDAAVAQAQSYKSVVEAGSYRVSPLDPRLCHFDRTSVRHAPQRGCTVKATLMRGIRAGGNLKVFCKIVDLFQRGDSIDALDMEVRNYATLQNLQGKVIPHVYGYYDVWGLLRLLALEDVGTVIPEDTPISTETRTLMKSALAHIHLAGYIHGDIARRNFCKKAGVVFLVDLETLVVGSPVEMEAELAQIDAL